MAFTTFTRLGIVNAFLVEEEDGLTLVDTTIRGAGKKIVAAAEALGKPIRRIALTHGHGDHVGAVDELAKLLPGVEVSIPERDARILAGDKSLEPDEPQSKVRGGWPKVKTSFDRLLVPGDIIGSLHVHAAPGHTPGQVAFVDARDGTMFCGDAFSTFGGVHTCAKPARRFPLPGMATWDKDLSVETARMLRALEPRTLAPGHGPVVQDPVLGMDAAIARSS